MIIYVTLIRINRILGKKRMVLLEWLGKPLLSRKKIFENLGEKGNYGSKDKPNTTQRNMTCKEIMSRLFYSAEIKFRASYMLGKCSTTELLPQLVTRLFSLQQRFSFKIQKINLNKVQ